MWPLNLFYQKSSQPIREVSINNGYNNLFIVATILVKNIAKPMLWYHAEYAHFRHPLRLKPPICKVKSVKYNLRFHIVPYFKSYNPPG